MPESIRIPRTWSYLTWIAILYIGKAVDYNIDWDIRELQYEDNIQAKYIHLDRSYMSCVACFFADTARRHLS